MRHLLLLLTFTLTCAAADPGPGPDAAKEVRQAFAEVRKLAQQHNRHLSAEALAKANTAAARLDAFVVAGGKPSWHDFSDLLWLAKRAREDLRAYEASLAFARRVIRHDKRGGRHTDARLQAAATYRDMKDYAKARAEYDDIVQANPDHRARVLLPLATMVYFDQGDEERGRQLVDEALRNPQVNAHERYRLLWRFADRALHQGRRQEASQWFARVEQLPGVKEESRLRYLTRALCELGRIEHSRGRTEAAKALYRRARDLEGGDPRYRVQARDAIESIEYFE